MIHADASCALLFKKREGSCRNDCNVFGPTIFWQYDAMFLLIIMPIFQGVECL